MDGAVRFGSEATVLGEHSVHCGAKFWMTNGFTFQPDSKLSVCWVSTQLARVVQVVAL